MAILTCKETVRFKAFTPAMVTIISTVATVAAVCTDVSEVVITSANDSTHASNSRHYSDEAIDLRTKNFPTLDAITRFAAALRAALGAAFTVLFEGQGTDNEHLHIQPKKGTTYTG